jgi:hypothetical protein
MNSADVEKVVAEAQDNYQEVLKRLGYQEGDYPLARYITYMLNACGMLKHYEYKARPEGLIEGSGREGDSHKRLVGQVQKLQGDVERVAEMAVSTEEALNTARSQHDHHADLIGTLQKRTDGIDYLLKERCDGLYDLINDLYTQIGRLNKRCDAINELRRDNYSSIRVLEDRLDAAKQTRGMDDEC